jgi:hypothetical protein
MILNQSHFLCPKCGEKHMLYGDIAPFYQTAQNLGISVLGELPVSGAVNEKGNCGSPYILDDGISAGPQGTLHIQKWRETIDAVCRKAVSLHERTQ